MRKKTVLVTGASRGIGQALCQRLKDENYKVYGGVRNLSQVTSRKNFTPIFLDLINDQSMIDTVDLILEKEGAIDVLYHVAGEAYYYPVEGLSIEELRHMYEVNLFGPFRLTQLVLPKMRERNEGRIIFTSSVRATAPCEFMGLYSGSKAAIETMAWDLYLTLQQWNIEVVVVQPGPVDSGIIIKKGSYLTEPHPYNIPKDVNLEWQTLKSAVDCMVNVVKEKKPPFRVQTSYFAKNMAEDFLSRVLRDEFMDQGSE